MGTEIKQLYWTAENEPGYIGQFPNCVLASHKGLMTDLYSCYYFKSLETAERYQDKLLTEHCVRSYIVETSPGLLWRVTVKQ